MEKIRKILKTRLRKLIFLLTLLLIIWGWFALDEARRYEYVEKTLSPTELARFAVERYLTDGKIVKLKGNPGGIYGERAPVFVSIYSLRKPVGLRGCIGTLIPLRLNVKDEIVRNAISAATRDKRFPPVKPGELKNLKYEVTILSKPQKVESLEELDPEKYGIIVSKNFLQKGVLLPGLVSIKTPEVQVKVAKEKAGIVKEDKVKIEKFKVKVYSEL